MELQLVPFEEPAEVREFALGRFELYHVGAPAGESLCQVEHVGLVMSGRAAVAMADGTERVMEPGDFFYVPPGHDSWVVGDEPYVSVHIMGSESYAT